MCTEIVERASDKFVITVFRFQNRSIFQKPEGCCCLRPHAFAYRPHKIAPEALSLLRQVVHVVS